ncbi:hypothetical protein NUSPORA_01123 [Nucleospora cyclopteri]
MPIYNLPALSPKKIISYFNELEIDITENDLNKPTQVFVTKFYMEILLIYANKNYSKASENSSFMLNFVKDISDFLSTIGLNNVPLKEIFNPSNKKFIVICSYIANFSMFRDSKKNLYEKASEIADSTISLSKKIANKKTNLMESINSLKENLQEHQNRCKELQAEIDANEGELKAAKNTQKDKISELSLLKKERMELNDKFCSLEMLDLNLKQDIKKLNGQIVTNPEELMSLVQEMRVLLNNEKNNVSSLTKVINERSSNYSVLNKTLEQNKKLLGIAEAIFQTEEEAENLEQREFLANSQMKNVESSIKNRKIRINHINRQINHIESKIDALEGKNRKLKEEMQQKLQQIKCEYEILTGEKKKNEEIRTKTNEEIQKIILEKTKKEGEFNKQCEELSDLLMELKTKIEINFIN